MVFAFVERDRFRPGDYRKKNPARAVVVYTLEHALNYTLNHYNNSHNSISKKSARKHQKLPGTFLCRFLADIGVWHLLYSWPLRRHFIKAVEGSPGF